MLENYPQFARAYCAAKGARDQERECKMLIADFVTNLIDNLIGVYTAATSRPAKPSPGGQLPPEKPISKGEGSDRSDAGDRDTGP